VTPQASKKGWYEMRKLFGLTIIALAAFAVVLAGTGSTTFAQQPGADDPPITSVPHTPLPQVHVCYDVDKGDTVNVDARLQTTNFGGDRVTIGRLVMMCELSTLNSADVRDPAPPTVPDTRIFACYDLRDGGNPGDPYAIKTVFFKDAVYVGQSNLMCETAAKYVTDAAGNVEKFGSASGDVRQCFDLKKGDDIGKTFVIANNNFGVDKIKTGAGVQMCEQAAKYRIINGALDVTGFANGYVEECFRIRGTIDPRKTVVLETENFGRDEVVVRPARMMCVPGEKSPIFTASIDTTLDPAP